MNNDAKAISETRITHCEGGGIQFYLCHDHAANTTFVRGKTADAGASLDLNEEQLRSLATACIDAANILALK